MSLLEELQKKKNLLNPSNTTVTYPDGRRFLETKNNKKELISVSPGFIIDTKPDFIPANILENKLFLGSQDCVNDENIKKYKLSHVLSVGVDCPTTKSSISQKKFIKCMDLPETNILDVCKESNEFISNAIENGGRILVHCNAGVSRSASIVIAYLMFSRRLSFDDAYSLCKTKRPNIQPNSGFFKQLQSLSLQIK